MARFPCRVDADGRLVPLHPERTSHLWGKNVWVEVHLRPTMEKRSENGNRYLWGVVYAAIASETGNDPETVHYALKREAVRIGVLDPQYVLLGDKLIEGEPTTVTDTDTFWRYVNWIREGCEHGTLIGMQLHIPEPNEAAA